MNVGHVCSDYTYMYLNVGTLFVNQWRRPAGQDKPVEQRLLEYQGIQQYVKSTTMRFRVL